MFAVLDSGEFADSTLPAATQAGTPVSCTALAFSVVHETGVPACLAAGTAVYAQSQTVERRCETSLSVLLFGTQLTIYSRAPCEPVAFSLGCAANAGCSSIKGSPGVDQQLEEWQDQRCSNHLWQHHALLAESLHSTACRHS